MDGLAGKAPSSLARLAKREAVRGLVGRAQALVHELMRHLVLQYLLHLRPARLEHDRSSDGDFTKDHDFDHTELNEELDRLASPFAKTQAASTPSCVLSHHRDRLRPTESRIGVILDLESALGLPIASIRAPQSCGRSEAT